MAIDKVLKIEGSSITWTCKQIVKMMEKETISFNNVVQRSFVWERHRMSELIWSIIMGYPIPPVYAERGESDNDKVKIYFFTSLLINKGNSNELPSNCIVRLI